MSDIRDLADMVADAKNKTIEELQGVIARAWAALANAVDDYESTTGRRI